jgi:hypothetical protein
MADDLSSRWGNFILTEDEGAFDEVHEEEFINIGNKGDSCLVGRVMSDRVIGKEAIQARMTRVWRPTDPVTFQLLGNNTFIIDFENPFDRLRVLEGRPWFFEVHLFSILEYDGAKSPSDLPFHLASFWMRMYRLPLACMGKATGVRLGAHVGEVEEVETNENGVGWREFLRVRVKLNMFKPLLWGRLLKVRDKTHWVSFQYEKIPCFCFSCGAICHGESGCPNRGSRISVGAEHKQEYGLWLRVTNRPWKMERYHNEYSSKSSWSRTNEGTEGHRSSAEQPPSEKEHQAEDEDMGVNHGESVHVTDGKIFGINVETFSKEKTVHINDNEDLNNAAEGDRLSKESTVMEGTLIGAKNKEKARKVEDDIMGSSLKSTMKETFSNPFI